MFLLRISRGGKGPACRHAGSCNLWMKFKKNYADLRALHKLTSRRIVCPPQNTSFFVEHSTSVLPTPRLSGGTVICITFTHYYADRVTAVRFFEQVPPMVPGEGLSDPAEGR